jgi:hypothetical protein
LRRRPFPADYRKPHCGRAHLIVLAVVLAAAKIALDHVATRLFWHGAPRLDMLARHRLRGWSSARGPWPARRTPPTTWLAQVALALSYRAGASHGVAVFKALFLAGGAWLLYRVAERRAGDNPRAWGWRWGLALFVAATHFIARPLLFGHLCLALVLLVVELVAAGRPRAALALPAIFARGSTATAAALRVRAGGGQSAGLGARAGEARPPRRARPPAGRGEVAAPGRGAQRAGALPQPAGARSRAAALRARRAGARRCRRSTSVAPVPWVGPERLALAGAGRVPVRWLSWRSKRPLPLYDLGLAALHAGGRPFAPRGSTPVGGPPLPSLSLAPRSAARQIRRRAFLGRTAWPLSAMLNAAGRRIAVGCCLGGPSRPSAQR